MFFCTTNHTNCTNIFRIFVAMKNLFAILTIIVAFLSCSDKIGEWRFAPELQNVRDDAFRKFRRKQGQPTLLHTSNAQFFDSGNSGSDEFKLQCSCKTYGFNKKESPNRNVYCGFFERLLFEHIQDLPL